MTDLFSGDPNEHTPPTRTARRRQHRRRADRRKNIVTFIVMLGALGLLIGGAFIFVKPLVSGMGESESNDFPGPGAGSVDVMINEGDTGAAIGATLVDAGVVKTGEAFKAAYNANPNATSIQAGTYALPQEMKAVDAVAALLDSAYRADLQITIPEGWTSAQVYERVATNLEIPIEDVEEAAATVGERLPSSADGDLEGWLAPSTYTVPPGSSARDVLGQMVTRTEETLEELNAPEDEQQELITKASIVEKEVPEKYRTKVARVIENRLEGCSGDGTLGMDTTLVFAFGKQYSEIPEDELRESPFNTRINPGLPPTPIGSPSKGAIEAMLDPADGNWCYFVTVNLETQETIFTDSQEEHKENQAKYREYLEELRSEPDDEQ